MNSKILPSNDFRQTALNQAWRLFSGPLLLLCIPLYLSAELQGYWYAFISLAALSIFADMGFSAILMTFASHEFAYLKFDPNKRLLGDANHIARIAGLGWFALKWSVVMGGVVFPIVLVVGFYVLSGRSQEVDWCVPWILYGVASILVFLNSMVLSFIEGCDSVGDIQKIRFNIGVVSVVTTLIMLYAGTGLYALACSLMLSAVVGSALLFHRYGKLFFQIFGYKKERHYDWAKEIMPLVWRYVISWISGYFILTFFAPVAFVYYSPVEAGQVGFSIAICTAIFGISNIWIVIITPKLGIMVARGESGVLNRIFFRSISLAVLTYLFGACLLFVIRDLYSPIVSRLVGVEGLIFLMLGWLFQLIINALAVYIRAHKEEPLTVISLFNAIYVFGLTFLIAMYFPFKLFFVGFLSGYFWVFPGVLWVFLKYKGRNCEAVVQS